MKKSFKLFKIAALACAGILVTGCSLFGNSNSTDNKANNTSSTTSTEVLSITLNYTELSMEYGDRQTLTATVTPEGTAVKWSTSKSSVAKVTDGTVEAVGAGTATITATAGKKSATCKVTVVDNRPVEVKASSVSINKSAVTIEAGESEQLIATITPDNTTDKSLTWSSSKTSVAQVDNNGVITTTKGQTGSATITVKTANNKSSTCKVTVVDTPVINNEKFTKENLYIFSGSFKFLLADPVQYDIRYTFKTDGTAIVEDKVKNTSKNGTYRINDGMIYIYNVDGSLSERYFYYDNIIMSASDIPVVLIRDGSAVSQKGNGTIGYFAIINVNVGDSLGVLNGESDSKGYSLALKANGTFASKEAYISGDQLFAATDFDTSKVCSKIIKITIGSKQYNCLFNVLAN